jgi:DNA-binding beta-propeller fold protein YncE
MIWKIGALVTLLLPVLVFAQAELKGTVIRIDKATDQLILKTQRGEETLLLSSGTKGIAHAKEGAKVVVKFSEKDGQPRVSEIAPQGAETKQPFPP